MIKQPVSAGFGFIVPEEELEAHLEDKEGTVYFRQTDIDCETMPKLNTKSYYYEVIYTPYILHGKTCAKDVKIGAGHPYPEKKSTAPVAVTAVTKKIVSKTLPLAEYLEAEETRYAGASPKLGIISLYNGHYALISDCYINKKLVTDQEYAPDGAIAIFNPELAQIETEEAIKTAKHCYLVKYVPGGTMVNEKPAWSIRLLIIIIRFWWWRPLRRTSISVLKLRRMHCRCGKWSRLCPRLAPPYRNRWILIFRSFAAGKV